MPGDQIEIQIPKTVFDENSAFTATAYFRTRATAAAATPTTVDYRIDNTSTRTERTGWTSVTPGTSVTIAVKSSDNKIQQQTSFRFGGAVWENIQLVVSLDKGLDTEVVGHKQWRIRNLYGVN